MDKDNPPKVELEDESDYRLYSDILYLKGIKRTIFEDGSIVERLLFEKGEIVLTAEYGSLEAKSLAYRPGNKPEEKRTVKHDIRVGISPRKAIEYAKTGTLKKPGLMSRLRYLDGIRAEKEAQKAAELERYNLRLMKTASTDNSVVSSNEIDTNIDPNEVTGIDGMAWDTSGSIFPESKAKPYHPPKLEEVVGIDESKIAINF